MMDEDFILDADESRSNTTPHELTGWEVLVFEIADEGATEDRGPRTGD